MRRFYRNYGLTATSTQAGSNIQSHRHFSQAITARDRTKNLQNGPLNIEELLSNPTWSVASLLPSKTHSKETPEISSKQLHHLLRLSALPPPKDSAEEDKMLSTLSSQLHFVKEIQKVDTTGVEPLQSLRDEAKEGEKEAELGLEALKEALAQERVVGKHHKRIRRQRGSHMVRSGDEWDVLGGASKKSGRFFVVEGGKNG